MNIFDGSLVNFLELILRYLMNTSAKHTLIFAFVVALGLCSIPSITLAQAMRSGGDFLQTQGISNNLNQNVYTLDTLADQMVFRFGWEMRSKKKLDSSDQELHSQMKAHAVLTNDLVKASRGKSTETFEKAARLVRDSANRLHQLQKKAEVSNGVAKLIDHSLPLASFVHSNARSFPQAPSGKIFGIPIPKPTRTYPLSASI